MTTTYSCPWPSLWAASCVILALSCSAARPKRDANTYSQCSSKTMYINGFSTFNPVGGAMCANRPVDFFGQITQCSWLSTQKRNYYSWNECPSGFFYRGYGFNEILCCKPSSHPRRISVCYNLNITQQNQPTQCAQDHYVKGSEDIQNGDAINTRTLKCCKMNASNVQSDVEFVDRIKDETQVSLSYLADYLGFGWCAGCRGHLVGENFVQSATGWSADTSGPCVGYNSNERLGIDYIDWKILQSNIVYEKAEISQMEPFSLSKGTVSNNYTSSITQRIEKTITKHRTVKHTKLSTFTFTHKVSSEFNVQFRIFAASLKYKFFYENREENFNAEETEDTVTDASHTEIPLKACTAVEYEIITARTKTTQYYTCDITLGFSVALRGFLRLGGGDDTNFHESYRESSARPSIRYVFGNENITFYDDLKYKSENSVPPWKWSDMLSKYNPLATTLIELLTNTSRYQQRLRGKFEGIESTSYFIKFTELETPAGCIKPENTDEHQLIERNADEHQLIERKKRQLKSPDDIDNWKSNSYFGSEALSFNKSFRDAAEEGRVWWKKLDLKTGQLYDVEEPQFSNLDGKEGSSF